MNQQRLVDYIHGEFDLEFCAAGTLGRMISDVIRYADEHEVGDKADFLVEILDALGIKRGEIVREAELG